MPKQHPETLKTETVATDDRKKPLQRHRRIAHDEKVRKYEVTGVSEQGFTEKSMK
jgi:hypothetical protein